MEEARWAALHEGLIRPSREDLEAAVGRTVPDVIAPGLRVLFCGINPGLYTAAVGHHFARPGNRFWPALYRAGFTERLYSAYEEERLLDRGLGITNLVNRATRGAAELDRKELRAGARALERKLRRYRPRALAVLGLGAYRVGFERPHAGLGRQGEMLAETPVWVLPNPSGANAYYQPEVLVACLKALRDAVAV